MSAEPAVAAVRMRSVIARSSGGQPRTYSLSPQPRTSPLSPQPAQPAAYRRLAVTILGLDVATLAHELRAARCFAHALPDAA